ncbi:MAG TPA: stress response translation initiation inhibitor YciH [Steroidobacteraceae bacterium]|nr:stress response translation initiation inhibitor YciH [Steroidobacteraceae bacterium]
MSSKPKHTFRGVVIDAAAAQRAARVPASQVPAGADRVRVARAVAGRGGKAVSVISGLALPEAQLEELATRLKRLCGAGGAVRDGTIEIQGEHRDRLVAELQRLGFAAKRAGG